MIGREGSTAWRAWAAGAVMLLAVDSAAWAQDPAAATAAARFNVNAIQVAENKLLPPERVEEILYPFMGPDRTAEDMETARAALQREYETRGYATVSVFLPEQSVDSGVIRFEVSEQAIGAVDVTGGDRTSRDWVLKRAPSLRPGVTPNFNDVQRDIVALNQSADRRISPEVKAGTAPGTVDIVLNVEDSFPLHGNAELNNFNSASTTDLRAAATLRYDDLWGRGDSISLSAQVAPRRPDDALVFSGNYLMRLGGVQLLGYYVHSDSDIAVIGGTSVVGKGDLAGLRLIVPLGQGEGFYHSLTAGADYKNFQEDVRLGADSSAVPIEYVPFQVGWRGDWTGETRSYFASLTSVFGFRGLGDGLARFDAKRFNARPNFFVVKGEGGATLDIVSDIEFNGRLAAQWSPAPLVSNEGFSLGGMDTVRGYFESEALGDWGVAFQAELRSPPLAPVIGQKWLNELTFHGFVDSGIAGIHDALLGQEARFELVSAGLGARVAIFDILHASIDAGVPVLDGPSSSGDLFARFRVWGEF